MAILSGVLGPRPLRRTVQVRLEVRVPAVARRHAHLCGLATAIHEISGLAVRSDTFTLIRERPTKKRQRHYSRCLLIGFLGPLSILTVPSYRPFTPKFELVVLNSRDHSLASSLPGQLFRTHGPERSSILG